jgi:hypothetical protein
VLLVRRLSCNTERLGDLRPGPAVGHGALDRPIFDAVRQTSKRTDSSECVRGIVGQRRECIDHASTLVDSLPVCQPRLLSDWGELPRLAHPDWLDSGLTTGERSRTRSSPIPRLAGQLPNIR